jgi:hypothetical protein
MAAEWDMIKRFKGNLFNHKEVTFFMQTTEEITITWAFPVLDKHMEDIEQCQDTGKWGHAAIRQSLHLAWEGLAKYYRVMSQLVYYVCLFLDPQIKTTYRENRWEEDWIAEAKNTCRKRCPGIKISAMYPILLPLPQLTPIVRFNPILSKAEWR